MKKLIVFLWVFFAVAMVAIQACDKDDDERAEPNQPPVAKAGNDTVLLITNCDPTVKVRLDGRSSYDPENILLSYIWKQLSGTQQAMAGMDSTHEFVHIPNLANGEYMFELEVVDGKGLSSKDSIIVIIKNIADYNEVEWELIGLLEFYDNYQYGNVYSDLTEIGGQVILPDEVFNFSINGTSDTTVNIDNFNTKFYLYEGTAKNRYLNGSCSVDFESLYLKGGGAFEGIIKVTEGSAFLECPGMAQEAPPIQVKGNLDAVTRFVTMKIKGKLIY